MNIASTQYSVSNNSFEIYLAGCDGLCGDDCHNKELWDFTIGNDYCSVIPDIIVKLNDYNDVIDSIWILGGEPLLNKEEDLIYLVTSIKTVSKKPVYLFTRKELADISDNIKSIFDFIKCGCYNKSYKEDNYVSNGVKLATSNQVVYKKGTDY